MADKKNRTSRLLLCTSFLVCAATGSLLTQPSATPSPLTDENRPDMIVADAVETESLPEEIVEELISPSPVVTETQAPSVTESPEPTEEIQPAEENEDAEEKKNDTEEAAASEDPAEPDTDTEPETTSTPEEEAAASPAEYQASPQAESGTWVYSDSSWYFRVNDENHHGWLYDTDHHVYYFDPRDGSMTTGWRDINGRRYYFDADGIMQTGRVRVDGQVYHMQSDGSLEGYMSPAETPAAEPEEESSSPEE